jgi:hypothetical protein
MFMGRSNKISLQNIHFLGWASEIIKSMYNPKLFYFENTRTYAALWDFMQV